MTRGKWPVRALALGIVAVGLVVLARSCAFDRRCLTNTYPAHCDGPIAVQCEGGKGSLPLVRRTDCRKIPEGPGTCVESTLDDTGRIMTSCLTPCDPATFVPRCEGAAAVNCIQFRPGDPYQVVALSCTAAVGCKLNGDAGGKQKAVCAGGQ